MKKDAHHSVAACLAVVLACVLTLGCAATYKAPERPTSEMAVIVADSNEVAILAVDGVRTSAMRGAGRAQVAVLPGEHAIMVQHRRNGNVAEGSLTVDVRGGKRYVLKSSSRGYHVVFWIEDVSMKTGPVI